MKLVIFDLDDTLVDTGDLIRDVFNETINFFGIKRLSREEYNELDFWKSKNSFEFEKKLKKLSLTATVRNFFDAFGKIHKELNLKRIEQGIINVYDDVLETLNDLKEKGLTLAIATNSRRDVAVTKLEKLNLLNFFDLIVTLNDVENSKPYPDQINIILNKLNFSTQDAFIVGDSIFDVLAGENAGINCILLDRKGEFKTEHPKISSLKEVISWEKLFQ